MCLTASKRSAMGRCQGSYRYALVASPLFGRFLVGLPHVSSGGVCCDDPSTAMALADKAIALADDLDVDFLELRHETLLAHTRLQHVVTDKAHMRMELPADERELWKQVGTKVRNQVRKAQQFSFRGCWGGVELLDEFYSLYAHRMRRLRYPRRWQIVVRADSGCLSGQSGSICCSTPRPTGRRGNDLAWSWTLRDAPQCHNDFSALHGREHLDALALAAASTGAWESTI